MTKSKNVLPPRKVWTEQELNYLRIHYPDQTASTIALQLGTNAAIVHAKAKRLNLTKSPAFWASDKAGRIQRGHQNPNMMSTQFKPGHSSWNKGMAGLQIGGVETRFKPGQRSHTWVPVGSFRINGDGYLDQKITDIGLPHKHWEAVHRLVWKRAHGPIAKNHVITFKPGRKTTTLELITLDAIECISRKELVQRNHPASHSPELFKLVQLRGAITRGINRRLKAATNEGSTP
jgi:hypothetical protein